jgi:hypothetical protein
MGSSKSISARSTMRWMVECPQPVMSTMPLLSTLTASDCSGVHPKKKSCRGMGPMLATPGAMTRGPSITSTLAVG